MSTSPTTTTSSTKLPSLMLCDGSGERTYATGDFDDAKLPKPSPDKIFKHIFCSLGQQRYCRA
jgi:hypothetical protein